jgi:hypothetical protein
MARRQGSERTFLRPEKENERMLRLGKWTWMHLYREKRRMDYF